MKGITNRKRSKITRMKMTIYYVLRGGRRARVGNGSLRNSFKDFFVGDVGTLRVEECDPVVKEIGERCTLVGTRTGS
jgi:hypothetical protein